MSTDIAIKAGSAATCVGLVDGQSFELAQRVATMLSRSTLIPSQYQNNIGNCVIALNIAYRIGADPLMVMQNLYVVHGTPSWSSQFLIACFNTSGRFSTIRYEFIGKQGSDDWGCRAWAVEEKTGERIEGSWVTIDLAKKEGWFSKNGSKWKTMPQQMLQYRAASFMIRAYAPEIDMGLHTREEVLDTYTMAQGGSPYHDREPALSIIETLNSALAQEETVEPSLLLALQEEKAKEVSSEPVASIEILTVICPKTGKNVDELHCAHCKDPTGCPAWD